MKMTIMHNGVTATIDGTVDECAKLLRELSVVVTPGIGPQKPMVDLSKGPSGAVAYTVDFTYDHMPSWKLTREPPVLISQ
ncbi:hypothetical protein [Chromobacterium haemolyticum]|uniref:hypothetical protein n=1 Tax=Chromobacterium haemolyticum TaxID=394935 RepID=UPI00131921B8|nr:hypothetical protein [Chromobacterium haemolyticum]BBH11717.1 hypothetical protein CH06BL_09650 [Chromobacterium haemolyticum]